MTKMPRSTKGSLEWQKRELKEISATMRLGFVYTTSTDFLAKRASESQVSSAAERLQIFIGRLRLPHQVLLEISSAPVAGFELPTGSSPDDMMPAVIATGNHLAFSRVEQDDQQTPPELYFGDSDLIIATSALAAALVEKNTLVLAKVN